MIGTPWLSPRPAVRPKRRARSWPKPTHKAASSCVGFADRVENVRPGPRGFDVGRQVAHAAERGRRIDEFARKRNRSVEQMPFFRQFVDDAPVSCVAGRKGRSRKNEIQRPFDADQPWQKLSAARARNEAELDLRQAEFGGRNSDSIVRGQGQLKAAAERRAMHCGDHRFVGVTDGEEHVGQVRRARLLVELSDICARDKRPSCAPLSAGRVPCRARGLARGCAEILFPALLVFGVATRFAATGLLFMTGIVELTIPDGWPIHITWAAMALGLMAWGPAGTVQRVAIVSLGYLRDPMDWGLTRALRFIP